MHEGLIPRPDGRVLKYARHGAKGGMPVFYFHGWPGSRREIGILQDLPVDVVALDRPGYGGSTAQPGRRLLDWPAEVAAVADALGIGRFAVVGASGGAPYATACAYAMPDRVISTTLMCPVPPASALLGVRARHMRDLPMLYFAGRHRHLAWTPLRAVRRLLLTPGLLEPDRMRGWLESRLPANDLAALDNETVRALLDSFRTGLRPGVAGQLDDASIYAAPWGFDFSQMRAAVRIWHGTDDTVVPVDTVAAYESIPRVQIHRLEREGHYSIVIAHGRRIIEALLADASRSLAVPQA